MREYAKLTAMDPEETRSLFKIVRLDTHQDVPGLILSASEETGLCLMRTTPASEATEYNFGHNGLRIVSARR